MKIALLFMALVTLAACGADGPPKPPGDQPGLTISGQVKVGVVGT